MPQPKVELIGSASGSKVDSTDNRLLVNRAATGIGQDSLGSISTTALVISSSQVCIRVEIMAHKDNAGQIYIGGITTATPTYGTTGTPLTIKIGVQYL